MSSPILKVSNLTKHFATGMFGKQTVVHAVEDVSFQINRGETFALVGESGCGKTTLTKLILALETPTSGSIVFDDIELVGASRADLARYRRAAQAVFQDPYSSLNPRLRVKGIISEPLQAQGYGDRAARMDRVREVLKIVGLPASAADLYPHEFSGGQRQRIAIARALAPQPPFMVLDEPISALDVSIRAQILNLLTDIQKEFGLTYLIVAHDLALVEQFSTNVGVMYLGNLVELGPVEKVFSERSHPYTQALLASVPNPDPDMRNPADMIRGEVGSPVNPPSGCKFHPRCPFKMDICTTEFPPRYQLDGKHWSACYLHKDDRATAAALEKETA
ncbi:ABC transporter ATP-binding protein [Microvirga zambiensis]|uniref:ABC transporter ATP-binding protein n=1 Tax=Microvirga zambiensis TaxID=1402137 RepID=UPI0019202449|nr:oligopeptide/dipeptide ABC transporter ATP-binding protein [Microvirga zambiensis]